MRSTKRVGLLTGGGDCPGLNAVIRAVSKSLMLQHGYQIIGFENGFEGLVRQRIRKLEYRDVSGILNVGGTILGSSNKCNPFQYHERGDADVSASVLQYYHELGLDAIVGIGGDGTMSILHRFQELGVNTVGVPKTIDNDLVGTDRTFGFDTAVSIAVDAIDRLSTTAQAHSRVMIIETMGRYAGWIALYAGVAGGADVILIPEFEYDLHEIARVCRQREISGQHFTMIAIAEGARQRGGEMVVGEVVDDSPDPIRLGGIAAVLKQQLSEIIRSEIRHSVLGHIQRGGNPTAYDRNLATLYGSYAAAMVAEHQYGRMVALQDNRVTSVALAEVANRTRTVPAEAPLIASALAVGTSLGVSDFDLRLSGSSVTHAIS